MESDDALLERCLERFPELQPADVSHMLSLFRSVVAHAEAAVPANSHELEATCVEAAALFDRVDVDGDGQVDIEELCASLQVCARALAGCSLGTSACAPLTRAHTRVPAESHFLHGKGGGGSLCGHGRRFVRRYLERRVCGVFLFTFEGGGRPQADAVEACGRRGDAHAVRAPCLPCGAALLRWF